jgi:crotonobetainyl-CoA:carnitine CoA-transferase CaiB-like acyl-CoA transferase
MEKYRGQWMDYYGVKKTIIKELPENVYCPYRAYKADDGKWYHITSHTPAATTANLELLPENDYKRLYELY